MIYDGELIESKIKCVQKKQMETRYFFHEYEAQVFFKHGGIKFHEGETYNDFYGKLTCVETAKERAKDICKRLHITKKSSLQIAVEMKLWLVEKIKIADNRYRNYQSIDSTEIKTEIVWTSSIDL